MNHHLLSIVAFAAFTLICQGCPESDDHSDDDHDHEDHAGHDHGDDK